MLPILLGSYCACVLIFSSQEDVLRLVKKTEELRSKRRERIHQIEWEQKMPVPEPAPRAPSRTMISERSWDEEQERIVEKEWYDRKSPRPTIMPPMPPPPPPMPRPTERERIVIVKEDRR